MVSVGSFRLEPGQVLFFLFCCYGFLLPFELVLEIWFGIDTILKPYRLIGILTFAIFIFQILRTGLKVTRDAREDLFLYAVMVYGIIISLFRIITGIFDLALFRGDIFLTSLYLLTFIVFKSTLLSSKQLQRVFECYVLGMIINAVFMFNAFFFLGDTKRDSGFMDNPNYAALGLVMVMTYVLLRLDLSRKLLSRIGLGIFVLFLLYVFVTTGSRTGFVLLVLSLAVIFLLVSLRQKARLVLAAGALVLFLLPIKLETAALGGPLILINRLAQSASSGETDVRFVVWKGTFHALEQEGYWGMGIGQFKANFPLLFAQETDNLIYRMVERDYFLGTHNDFLSILTDYGLPGLCCYVIFLVLSVRKVGRKILIQPSLRSVGWLSTMQFITILCLIVFGLTAESFQNPLFWFLLMFATKSPTGGQPAPVFES